MCCVEPGWCAGVAQAWTAQMAAKKKAAAELAARLKKEAQEKAAAEKAAQVKRFSFFLSSFLPSFLSFSSCAAGLVAPLLAARLPSARNVW
jgi:hypothetical protein